MRPRWGSRPRRPGTTADFELEPQALSTHANASPAAIRAGCGRALRLAASKSSAQSARPDGARRHRCIRALRYRIARGISGVVCRNLGHMARRRALLVVSTVRCIAHAIGASTRQYRWSLFRCLQGWFAVEEKGGPPCEVPSSPRLTRFDAPIAAAGVTTICVQRRGEFLAFRWMSSASCRSELVLCPVYVSGHRERKFSAETGPFRIVDERCARS